MKTVLLSIFFCFYSVLAFSQGGIPDITFDNDGIAVFAPGTSHDNIYDLAVQSDGKIVIGGVTDGGGFNLNLALARLNGDGTVDTDFATDGWYIQDFNGQPDYIFKIVLLPGGGILICGAESVTASNTAILVMKFTASGDLDLGFGGGDGIATHDLNPGEDYARDMVVQDNGGILLAGSTTGSDFTVRGMVMQLLSDGTMDTSFGTNGISVGGIQDAITDYRGIVLDDSDNVIVAGYADQNFSQYILVSKFTSEGDLVTTFADNGHYVAEESSRAFDVAWINNHIVLGGLKNVFDGFDLLLAAIDASGAPDLTFGTDGEALISLAPSDFCLSMAIQTDGKIVVAGSTGNGAPSTSNFFSARFSAGGVVDTNYGVAGSAIITVGPAWAEANGIALDNLGNVFLGGFAAGDNNDMVVVKLGNVVASVDESISSSSFGLYPNPVSSILNISCHSEKSGSNVTITNATGSVLLSEAILGNSKSIDISQFPSGVYFVNISGDVNRFIKN